MGSSGGGGPTEDYYMGGGGGGAAMLADNNQDSSVQEHILDAWSCCALDLQLHLHSCTRSSNRLWKTASDIITQRFCHCESPACPTARFQHQSTFSHTLTHPRPDQSVSHSLAQEELKTLRPPPSKVAEGTTLHVLC